jgi:long-subunit fatty acid transport protein
MSPPRPPREVPRPARELGRLVLGLALLALPDLAGAQAFRDQDQIDITGRQNLTLGSGARAYGMGGAFLARADDATAASWNPAGLSYLRLPELSIVGNYNSFNTELGTERDRFEGGSFDFAALTWPVGVGDVRGAVQLSYQRAISFDGTRTVTFEPPRRDDARSNGGFDVVAFGTGLRLSRRIRAGLTVNRWLNGYEQTLKRTVTPDSQRPVREFDLDFRPRGWSFNLGVIVSPIEQLNLAAVYKTSFTAGVGLDKERRDYWAPSGTVEEVTRNSYSSEVVSLEFPSAFGVGVSWRVRDTLTLSMDFTRTGWSKSRILDYFELNPTDRTGEDGTPAVPPAPVVFPELQYPTLREVPATDDPEDPLRLEGQQDAEQIRVGAEYVVIKGRLKVPLRVGYFNDRQIAPNPGGAVPRFNGVTVGTGIILGSVLLDVAYLYEFGEYYVTQETASGAGLDEVPAQPSVRNALRTRRFFASMIYRFGRP